MLSIHGGVRRMLSVTAAVVLVWVTQASAVLYSHVYKVLLEIPPAAPLRASSLRKLIN